MGFSDSLATHMYDNTYSDIGAFKGVRMSNVTAASLPVILTINGFAEIELEHKETLCQACPNNCPSRSYKMYMLQC